MNELDEEKARLKKTLAKMELEVQRLRHIKERRINYDRLAIALGIAILVVVLLFKIFAF